MHLTGGFSDRGLLLLLWLRVRLRLHVFELLTSERTTRYSVSTYSISPFNKSNSRRSSIKKIERNNKREMSLVCSLSSIKALTTATKVGEFNGSVWNSTLNVTSHFCHRSNKKITRISGSCHFSLLHASSSTQPRQNSRWYTNISILSHKTTSPRVL